MDFIQNPSTAITDKKTVQVETFQIITEEQEKSVDTLNNVCTVEEQDKSVDTTNNVCTVDKPEQNGVSSLVAENGNELVDLARVDSGNNLGTSGNIGETTTPDFKDRNSCENDQSYGEKVTAETDNLEKTERDLVESSQKCESTFKDVQSNAVGSTQTVLFHRPPFYSLKEAVEFVDNPDKHKSMLDTTVYREAATVEQETELPDIAEAADTGSDDEQSAIHREVVAVEQDTKSLVTADAADVNSDGEPSASLVEEVGQIFDSLCTKAAEKLALNEKSSSTTSKQVIKNNYTQKVPSSVVGGQRVHPSVPIASHGITGWSPHCKKDCNSRFYENELPITTFDDQNIERNNSDHLNDDKTINQVYQNVSGQHVDDYNGYFTEQYPSEADHEYGRDYYDSCGSQANTYDNQSKGAMYRQGYDYNDYPGCDAESAHTNRYHQTAYSSNYYHQSVDSSNYYHQSADTNRYHQIVDQSNYHHQTADTNRKYDQCREKQQTSADKSCDSCQKSNNVLRHTLGVHYRQVYMQQSYIRAMARPLCSKPF